MHPILSTIAIVALVVTFALHGRNAVWGGASLGLLVGIVMVAVSVFKGSPFRWTTITTPALMGAIVGVGAALLGAFGDALKRRRHKRDWLQTLVDADPQRLFAYSVLAEQITEEAAKMTKEEALKIIGIAQMTKEEASAILRTYGSGQRADL